TTFVKIVEEEKLTDILLGGSLGNVLTGIANGLVLGDVGIEVEVYGTGGRFINRSSDDRFNDNEIRLIVGADNAQYLAITPSQPYNQIRISSVTEAIIGVLANYHIDVYDVFYYSGTQTCGGPMGTSYDVSGVNLDLLTLGSGTLAGSLGRSIDGDTTTYSVLSPGVLNLAGAVHQHFYFPASGLPTDELKITLGLSQQLLNLSVLGQVELILYENDAVVYQEDLEDLGDELLNIVGLDLLGLFASGEPATFGIRPGVAFDRAEIRLGSLLSTS